MGRLGNVTKSVGQNGKWATAERLDFFSDRYNTPTVADLSRGQGREGSKRGSKFTRVNNTHGPGVPNCLDRI